MASITLCYRNLSERMRDFSLRMLRSLCILTLGWLAATVTVTAHAGSIEPLSGELTTAEDGSTRLNASFNIELGPRLEDAVSRGVPLYFNFEFELTRPRWWWSNEHIASKNLTFRLSYAALTRQYRLTMGNLHRNFTTLDEALRVMSRLVDLHIADRGVLKFGETYEAGMRLAFDRNQLPKPFQVDALGNRDWQVETRVLRWTYVPTPYAPPPPPPPPPSSASAPIAPPQAGVQAGESAP